MTAFFELASYRLAAELADYVYEVVLRWPQPARYAMGSQLMRSADSIAANIAESAGRETNPDKRHLLVVARGSLRETEHWLRRAHARGLVDAVPTPELNKLGRLLHGQIRKLR